MPTRPESALARIRREGGAVAVRSAIMAALVAHPSPAEAARALGTTARALQAAARRVGVTWTERPAGRPKARREAG